MPIRPDLNKRKNSKKSTLTSQPAGNTLPASKSTPETRKKARAARRDRSIKMAREKWLDSHYPSGRVRYKPRKKK